MLPLVNQFNSQKHRKYHMKRILLMLSLPVLLFAVLTAVTASIEKPFDGNNNFGFPFRFYTIYGGKRSFYPSNEFSAFMLLIDVMLVYLAVWLSNVFLVKMKKNMKNA